jgi:hypothetical protein
MDANWVEAIGTWFSGILVAGSLIFIWIQTSHLREQTIGIRQSTYQKIYDTWFEVDKLFIDRPKLRPFFYEGTELAKANDEMRPELDAIAQMILDCFDNVYHQREFMPPDTFKAWSTFLKDMYRKSPYLIDFLDRNWPWYPATLVEHLKEPPNESFEATAK